MPVSSAALISSGSAERRAKTGESFFERHARRMKAITLWMIAGSCSGAGDTAGAVLARCSSHRLTQLACSATHSSGESAETKMPWFSMTSTCGARPFACL